MEYLTVNNIIYISLLCSILVGIRYYRYSYGLLLAAFITPPITIVLLELVSSNLNQFVSYNFLELLIYVSIMIITTMSVRKLIGLNKKHRIFSLVIIPVALWMTSTELIQILSRLGVIEPSGNILVEYESYVNYSSLFLLVMLLIAALTKEKSFKTTKK